MFKHINGFIMLSMDHVLILPANKNLSYYWNFGSMLGIILMAQIITGIILTISFNIGSPFYSTDMISRESNFGFMFRWIHMNLVSMFFIFIYFHALRGIWNCSFQFKLVWFSGTMLLLLLMMTSFLGYVLPWGQMSFWAATVITNLFSAIPLIGEVLVILIWGNFSVSMPTLTFFFALHFLLPFILLVVVIFHMIFLHMSGSSSNIKGGNNYNKEKFSSIFILKDSLNLFIIYMLLFVSFLSPYIFCDSENFIPANPLSSPIHIQPEWYFLWMYAILRAIPSKLGGVIALFLSVLILFLLSLSHSKNNKLSIILIMISVFNLTWLGAMPVEAPYILLSMMLTLMYFIAIFMLF